jgi:hypothetical protein
MAGTVIVDTINSSVAGTPPVFQAGGTQIGTLCRAWVNFNGTGTVAIRASFNVSSITDNGTGDYTVNFTNAMPDANYSVTGQASNTGYLNIVTYAVNNTSAPYTYSTSAVRIASAQATLFDSHTITVAIFR